MRSLAELAELRAEVAKGYLSTHCLPYGMASRPTTWRTQNLIEISTAVERFNRPADSLRL